MHYLRSMRVAAIAAIAVIGAALSASALAQSSYIAGTASASSQSSTTRSAAKANDRDFNTRWEASNSSPGSWLKLSFSKPQTINRVELQEYGTRIQGYRVEYLNGSTWVPVLTGSALPFPYAGSFPEVTTSAIRLYVTKASGQPSISEFAAYGKGVLDDIGYYPGCKIPAVTGVVDNAAIVVAAGEVFDGANQRFNGRTGGESNPPVFRVEEGGVVRNVIVGITGMDAIYCMGNCTLQNVWFENVAEDPISAYGAAGTVADVSCGAAYRVQDKAFFNFGRGHIRVSQFFVAGASTAGTGRLYRSCGECTNNGGPRTFSATDVIAKDLRSIADINTNFGDVVTLRRLTLNNTMSNPTAICRAYFGVQKGTQARVLGTEFDTANCQVSPSDITLTAPSQYAPASCSGSCPY